MPGTGGTKGSAPAAITMLLVVSFLPSTSTLYGDSMVALPAKQSTPKPVYRSTESCGSIFEITLRIRVMTSEKSNSACAVWIPNSALRFWCAMNFAVRISAFEGTQPVFRQSPPMLPFSTRATFALTAAAMYAATSPADPAPITTTLKSNFFGLGNFPSTLRDLTTSMIFFAISGKMPSNTNDVIKAGDKIPLSESILASWVPAFT